MYIYSSIVLLAHISKIHIYIYIYIASRFNVFVVPNPPFFLEDTQPPKKKKVGYHRYIEPRCNI